MKHVNFITTLSPQKQYAIKRWFWVTFFLCTMSVLVSVFFIKSPLLMYMSLKKEINTLREQTKSYGEHTKQRDILKTEHELFRVRSNKMEQYTDRPKNPHTYVAAVVQACGEGVSLESLNMSKKNAEIIILCPTQEHATVFIKRLSGSELFNGIKLVSLQQDNQKKQLRCVVKATVLV